MTGTAGSKPAEILGYWQDLGPGGWYAVDPAVDAEIRRRFLADWQAAEGGAFLDWVDGGDGGGGGGADAQSALAYLLLTDQFPRNMFRGDPRSFATDARARAAAEAAVARGFDLKIPPPLRQFFYLPWMHAEDPAAQARCIAHFAERMPDASNLLHARAHARVIDRFGRFPHRNAVLGRESSAAEQAFLDGGGYRQALSEIEAGFVPQHSDAGPR